MNPLLDTLVVKMRSWDEERLADLAFRYGGKVEVRMPAIKWASIKIDHTKASDLFMAFSNDPDVEDVTFDTEGVPHSIEPWAAPAEPITNPDPLIVDMLWTLKKMNVHAAWKYTKGAGVRISTCDTGINFGYRTNGWYGSRDLVCWNGVYDADEAVGDADELVDCTQDKMAGVPPWLQHGAGTLSTMSMIAPEAALCSMRLTDMNGNGYGVYQLASLLCSYDRFGCLVMNLSWGAGNYSGTVAAALAANPTWRDGLAYLRDHGAVVCMSSGNSAISSEPGLGFTGNIQFQMGAGFGIPQGHFGVAAIGPEDDRPVAYSNYGAAYNAAAPTRSWTNYDDSYPTPASAIPQDLTNWPFGVVVMSSIRSAWRNFDGTSGASPAMAGVCALVKSAYPGLGGQQTRDLILETGFVGDHPEFAWKLPNARIPDALRAVLKAKSLNPVNAGVVYPYVSFRGRGVRVDIDPSTLESTTHLGGIVKVVVGAYSSASISRVEMWADTDLIYSGPPLTWDAPLLVSSDQFVGKTLKVIGYSGGTPTEIQYSDVVAHAVGTRAPPVTRASLPAGAYTSTRFISLTVQTDAYPVRTQFRWGSGPWQLYTAPIPVQSGTLQFYSVDCQGNVEGGVDYASP